MSSSAVCEHVGPRAKAVRVDNHTLHVTLQDESEISTPLEWFPRLRDASPGQRDNWQLIGSGVGIHWPEIDEDLSVEGLLRGTQAVA